MSRRLNQRFLFPPQCIPLQEAATKDKIVHFYTNGAGDAIQVSEVSEPRRLEHETLSWLQTVIKEADDYQRVQNWVNPNPWSNDYE